MSAHLVSNAGHVPKDECGVDVGSRPVRGVLGHGTGVHLSGPSQGPSTNPVRPLPGRRTTAPPGAQPSRGSPRRPEGRITDGGHRRSGGSPRTTRLGRSTPRGRFAAEARYRSISESVQLWPASSAVTWSPSSLKWQIAGREKTLCLPGRVVRRTARRRAEQYSRRTPPQRAGTPLCLTVSRMKPPTEIVSWSPPGQAGLRDT